MFPASKSPLKTQAALSVPATQCLNAVVLEDFESKVVVTSMQERHQIDQSVVVEKKQMCLKVKPYAKIAKPKVKPRQMLFSLFLGLHRFQGCLFLVFAEHVRRQVVCGRSHFIFEIADVVFYCLDTFSVHRELSETATRLMSRCFYFSYDVDLTRPLSPSNAQEFRTHKSPHWLYMVNFGMMFPFLTNRACGWVIPVVFGEFFNAKFHFSDTTSSARLWAFNRRCVFDLIGSSENNLFVNNLLGAPRFHSVEVFFRMNSSQFGLVLHLASYPRDEKLTEERAKRIVTVMREGCRCSRILVLEEESEDLEAFTKMLEDMQPEVTVVEFGRLREAWSALDGLFTTQCKNNGVLPSVGILVKQVDTFSKKYLSFILTTFLFAAKRLADQAAPDKDTKSARLVSEATDDVRADAEHEDSQDEVNCLSTTEIKPLGVPKEQIELFDSFAPKNHTHTTQDSRTDRPSLSTQASPTFDTRANQAHPEAARSPSLTRRARPDSINLSFNSKKTTQLALEDSWASVEDSTPAGIDWEHPKFTTADSLINIKLSRIQENLACLNEVHNYFRSKTNLGVIDSIYRLMKFRNEKIDANLDKLMQSCRLLSHSLFNCHEPIVQRLRQVEPAPYFAKLPLRLCLFSVNAGGFSPTLENFKEIVFFNGNKPAEADVLVVCVQEAILMKASRIKDIVLEEADGEARTQWSEVLIKNFPEFNLSFAKQLCGLVLVVLTRRTLVGRVDVSLLETNVLRLGAFNFANKGAVSACFRISHLRAMVVNCHFAAGNGQKMLIKRLDNLRAAMRLVESAGEAPDIAILVGDFNFRMLRSVTEANTFLDDVSKLQEKLNILKRLFQHPQNEDSTSLPWVSDFQIFDGFHPSDPETLLDFTRYKAFYEERRRVVQEYLRKDELGGTWESIASFAKYKLLSPDFPPTYRFFVGKDQYDFKNGERIPSYTDRVVLGGENPDCFELSEFGCDPHTSVSDHKPIYLLGTLHVPCEVSSVFNPLFDARFPHQCAPQSRQKNSRRPALAPLNHFFNVFKSSHCPVPSLSSSLYRLTITCCTLLLASWFLVVATASWSFKPVSSFSRAAVSVCNRSNSPCLSFSFASSVLAD